MCYSSLMATTESIWKLFLEIFGNRGGGGTWSLYTPLWRDARLPELLTLLAFEYWPWKGIKYVTQLFTEGTFRSFADFQQELNLPSTA